jgi:hypothetical protein
MSGAASAVSLQRNSDDLDRVRVLVNHEAGFDDRDLHVAVTAAQVDQRGAADESLAVVHRVQVEHEVDVRQRAPEDRLEHLAQQGNQGNPAIRGPVVGWTT